MEKYILKAPDEYYLLSEEDKNVICNGVGAVGDWKSKYIPKTIYGLDITECANIHDYMYYIGKTILDKTKADDIFLENMNFLISVNNWWLIFLRKRRAYKYYIAVRFFGKDAFFNKKL